MTGNRGTITGADTRTVARCRVEVREALQGVVASPARMADWIIASVTSTGTAELIARGDETLDSRMRSRIGRRTAYVARGWPLQYVTRTMPFHGVRLTVDGRVLIPRPETEQLVERSLELIRGKSSPVVMDVCSGSGSIALALKMARSDAQVCGVELSQAALAAAVENAARLGLHVDWVRADVLVDDVSTWLAKPKPAGVDLVVSNPPYIAAGEENEVAGDVYAFEPHAALFAGDGGLGFYDRIVRAAAALLTPGGWLTFEGHEDRMDRVKDLMRAAGFTEVVVAADGAGRPRFAEGKWAGSGGGECESVDLAVRP